MRIHDIGRDPGIASNPSESIQGKTVAPQPEENLSAEQQKKGEEVSLSQASLAFKKAAEMMERESPERAERIRSIQKAIENGTYHVEAAKIADKMIRDGLSE